ncbi:hypothetical protein FPV58_18935 [Mycolicibacterium porcinum]|uniref:hypothetical protein n=1 Tax=Mycolicibacterium porcinum TaxID=39693 RepID=UPI001193C44A|nr:hypothetical protein [Mycolicibacterium porcinum]TVX99339.1 hypothetical protein FPV58_18935 [Mycolicibacterium porcinum]
MYVTTDEVGELVTSAGGWICDRIRTGWDVTVSVEEPCDVRPLHILGVTAVVVGQPFDSVSRPEEIAAVAFPSRTFDQNEPLRAEVVGVLDRGAAEVTTWGSVPSEIDGRVRRHQYQLSDVARAFKTYAVAAAWLPAESVGATEALYTSRLAYEAPDDRPHRGGGYRPVQGWR